MVSDLIEFIIIPMLAGMAGLGLLTVATLVMLRRLLRRHEQLRYETGAALTVLQAQINDQEQRLVAAGYPPGPQAVSLTQQMQGLLAGQRG